MNHIYQLNHKQLTADLEKLDIYQIIAQFIQSERQYSELLTQLSQIESSLKIHATQGNILATSDEINAIFCNGLMSMLTNFTTGLEKNLTKLRFSANPTEMVQQLANLLYKEIQFFKAYGQYTIDVRGGCEALTAVYNKNKNFKTFVHHVQQLYDLQVVPRNAGATNGSSNLSNNASGNNSAQENCDGLMKLLLVPQQHFPTYAIYLQGMTRALSSAGFAGQDVPDWAPSAESAMNTTFHAFLDVLTTISQKNELVSKQKKLLDLQTKQFKNSITLISASRQFVKSAVNLKIKESEKSKPENLALLLFDDLIISAKVSGDTYKYHNFLPIAGLIIEPLPPRGDGTYHFALKSTLLPNTNWEVEIPNGGSGADAGKSAEKNYVGWLLALTKTYNKYYSIGGGDDQNNNNAAMAFAGNLPSSPSALQATSTTQCVHPEDTEMMIKKGKYAGTTPRLIPKPAQMIHGAAIAEIQKLQQQINPNRKATPGVVVSGSNNTNDKPSPSSRSAPPLPPGRGLPPTPPDSTSNSTTRPPPPMVPSNVGNNINVPSIPQRLSPQGPPAFGTPTKPPTMPMSPPRPPTMPPAPPTTAAGGPPPTPAIAPAATVSSSVPPTVPAVTQQQQQPANPRAGLLGAIASGGIQLKKAEDRPIPTESTIKSSAAAAANAPSTNTSASGGGGGNLISALQNYRKFVSGDDEVDEDDDDDEWD